MSAPTVLLSIPSVKLLHIPAPGQEPITLASGELSLTELPSESGQTGGLKALALSVDHATFPITVKAPISPVETNQAHPSYVFRPAGLDAATSPNQAVGGLGKVKIVFAESKNPSDYEAVEALARAFESTLREHKVWKDHGYYDDEDEIDREHPEAAGYGTTVADTLTSYARMFSNKLAQLTDSHVDNSAPLRPTQPGDGIKSLAHSSEGLTSRIAGVTGVMATTIGNVVHDTAKYVGDMAHQTAQDLDQKYGSGGHPGPVRQQVNETAQGVKEMGQAAYNEAAIAGKGALDAAETTGSAISNNMHKEIAHDLGPESDKVAQDIGQSGANLAAAGGDVALSTTSYVHGFNAATGAGQGLAGQK